jgi:hypothetical protein
MCRCATGLGSGSIFELMSGKINFWRFSVKIRRVFVLLFSAIAVLALFTGVLSAHHGRAGYDTKGQGITLRGVVTEYKWINPHVFLNWNVKNEKGEVVEWTGEFSSPTTMISEGMGKNTFKAGDEIIATVIPAKGNVPHGLFLKITRADGQVVVDLSERRGILTQ